MMDLFRNFFRSDCLDPHGTCLSWRPELTWTHAVSDVLIGLAYFSIAAALGMFLRHRRDLRLRWVIWLLVLFITLSGVTHFMNVWTLWRPDYAVAALVNAATAIASLATAAALWPLLPRAIALPSRDALQQRVLERDEALAELRTAMATMMEMREHEARQKLLLDELNHRVKNTLSSVQSIAAQTLDRAGDLESARKTFLDRLMALSATHNLLVRREWGTTSFHELATDMLAPYGRPYAYAGPDLLLEPNTTVTLGMALHELATNALRHGAWSGDGIVTVEVAEMADGEIQIVWLESGGPRVPPPGPPGFGSRLLESGVAREMGGSVSLEYRPDGVVCTIRAHPSDRMRFAP
jgi:two-component sensor histidine kinase